MNDEIMKLNEEKILHAFKTQRQIHISLKDGTWRNGFVEELSADFFFFLDKINGREPIFFLELRDVEPFLRREDKDDR